MSTTSKAGPDAGTNARRPSTRPATTCLLGQGLRAGLAVGLGAATLGGCVTVKAPSGPIVVQLDVNIKQEVVYRLAEDAGNTIKQNPEIF